MSKYEFLKQYQAEKNSFSEGNFVVSTELNRGMYVLIEIGTQDYTILNRKSLPKHLYVSNKIIEIDFKKISITKLLELINKINYFAPEDEEPLEDDEDENNIYEIMKGR